ncbi:uncharacterized protein EI90DRAFT_3060308 [Cantharellus anzutake]|uniref:uncharacterized protein n=1 Tax=Cantharellus anzutake TaxID=1750568 RepID=UPI001907A2D2|nr:uncharacterized protein EI90DRAFT_3060308 [Cantharellus anzutake]KAF8330326.1 hypothetical protein EI90DRAFT_3060308 [Cantharellus anzutake]
MSWIASRAAGSSSSADVSFMNMRDIAEHIRSTFELLIELHDFDWTQEGRTTVLRTLYSSMFGNYGHYFSSEPPGRGVLLSEHQAKTYPSQNNDIPGMPCGHIFKRGECCYKCKDCAVDDSCVLCSRCFHASSHEGHNVSFYISLQPGGCCDCGDEEAWSSDIKCKLHPLGSVLPPARQELPPELVGLLKSALNCVVDYILDTFDDSPEEALPPADETSIIGPPNDLHRNGPYAVVVWNDEKHSFDEVTSQLLDLTDHTPEQAFALTDKVDAEGRAVISIIPHLGVAMGIASRLYQIDLGVTVRRASDTFREQLSAFLIEWLVDLTRCTINGTDAITLKELVASCLLDVRPRHVPFLHPNLPHSNLSRLEWLFSFHTRFWRRPRLILKDLYITLISISHHHKVAVASRFATVYNCLMDSYLLVDREPDTSVKYFAVQLFTVPSVAGHIVRNQRIIDRLLNIIVAFFTNQISNKVIEAYPRRDRDVNIDSPPFRSKRFMPIFSDLRHLCGNGTVQKLIASDDTYITNFTRVCRLFVGINPNKRASETHVEYEQDSWISVFNVTLSLSRVAKAYAEAFKYATTASLCNAIKMVAQEIISVCSLHSRGLDLTKYEPLEWREIQMCGHRHSIIDFDVLSGNVSFHHSQHWLLAELIKHVNILTTENLRKEGYNDLRDVLLRLFEPSNILIIMEFPLRVLVMVAQIRSGLWVRNGLAIRGQLLHYRDFMLRELCYDQDLFIIQTAFVLLEPNIVFVSILHRFQLIEWFSGNIAQTVYDDPQQRTSMIEEFLYVIITCLTEYANAKNLTVEDVVRREAIHGLACGACSYTELCKRVAERIIDEPSFDKALSGISNFRAPEGTTDVGIYELKDELWDEVNPFFFHYSRNRREEVEAALETRITKKTGNRSSVVVPRAINVTEGPFTELNKAFTSRVFLQILVVGIFNITQTPVDASHSSDATLDQILHLLFLALVEQPVAFSSSAGQITFSEANDRSLFMLLCELEGSHRFDPVRKKVGWALSELQKHLPQEVASMRRLKAVHATDANSSDAKRRAAKARQAAIMKQFAAQQKSVLLHFEDEGVDEEEMDEVVETMDPTKQYGSCIVCQEDLDHSRAYGALGLVQPSRFRHSMSGDRPSDLADSITLPLSLDETIPAHELSNEHPSSNSFGAFSREAISFALHGSFCGHFMHVDCFKVYKSSIEQRHLQQPHRNHAEKTDREEFICPLCKSLGNVILPLYDDLTFKQPIILPQVSLSDWIKGVSLGSSRTSQDHQVDVYLSSDGSGELSFWTAEDRGYHASIIDDTDFMVDSLRIVSEMISQQSGHLHGRSFPSSRDRAAGLYLPKHLVANSIACVEISIRGVPRTGDTLVDNVGESSIHMIRSLLVSLRRLASLQLTDHDGGQTAIHRTLVKRLLPQCTRGKLRSPVLFRDPLTILVEAAAVAPDMIPYVTSLMFYASLVRNSLGLISFLSDDPKVTCPPVHLDNEHQNIFGDFRQFVLLITRHSHSLDRTAERVLHTYESYFDKLLVTLTLPFLRRAAILVHAVNRALLLPVPPAKKSSSEFLRLLEVLQIPLIGDLHKHEGLRSVLGGWCSAFGAFSTATTDCSISLEVPFVYHLARLPYALDTLFADQRTLLCQRCSTVPADAAICMFCGVICCYQMHCCTDKEQRNEGECNMHTRECGGVVGLYYCVKRCAILSLYGGSGTLTTSPYLDEHGETDFAMRRGRRQYLHHRRMEEIRKMWVNHGIPTFVARKLDSTIDVGGWDSV